MDRIRGESKKSEKKEQKKRTSKRRTVRKKKIFIPPREHKKGRTKKKISGQVKTV